MYDDARDTPNSGPTPIINIKKEKRETEEETKEILRKLERDNVMLNTVPYGRSSAQTMYSTVQKCSAFTSLQMT